MAELQVNILSPAKVVAKTKASQVQLPGALGYLGILPGHTRFITELQAGAMTVEGAGGKQVYFVSGGYADQAEDVLTVLVDVVEKPVDIDVARAERAKQRALERLGRKEGIDFARAQAALARAEQRLMVAGKK